MAKKNETVKSEATCILIPILRPILILFLLLTTTFLSASIYPPISSEKCLQDVMFHFAEHTVGDEEIYYYHGDHLGSASWITLKNGSPIQYIHYLPYGEILANQTPHGYDERFKFTGKELDAESGYYYFNARYLLSELGDFISTDPHLDARPRISSYAYCSWNPINKTDPDGMDDEQRQAAVDLANKYVEKNRIRALNCTNWGQKKGSLANL